MIDSHEYCNICGKEVPLHHDWDIHLTNHNVDSKGPRKQACFNINHVCQQCALEFYEYIKRMVTCKKTLERDFYHKDIERLLEGGTTEDTSDEDTFDEDEQEY